MQGSEHDPIAIEPLGADPRPEPAPIDAPKANGHARALIDPKAPLDIARQVVETKYRFGKYRTLHHQQSVFQRWNGTHYAPVLEEELRAGIYSFLEKAVVQGKDGFTAYKPTQTAVSGVFDALRAVCQIASDTRQPSWLWGYDGDPAAEIIACKNGLLHLPTGILTPHTPAFFGASSLTYDYNPEAPKPEAWLKFLNDVWGSDIDSIATLQDIFGYLLGNDTDQQKLFLAVGPKRSGKGTIARVANSMLGEDAVVSPTLASLETNFGIAPLIGKSTGIIADARLSSRADQHRIAERLLSISGEDKQTIDRKFLPAWSGRLPIRFFIMTNELPKIADASGALISRFIVLTMTKSFYGHEDRGLTKKLMAELPGILNWAIDGWRRIKSRGHFIQPKASAEAVRDLEDLGSPIAAFVRDKCILAPGREVVMDDMFVAWTMWCKDQARSHPGTKQSFGRDLRSVVPGLASTQPTEDGERIRKYQGIDLIEPIDKQDENYWNWRRDQF